MNNDYLKLIKDIDENKININWVLQSTSKNQENYIVKYNDILIVSCKEYIEDIIKRVIKEIKDNIKKYPNNFYRRRPIYINVILDYVNKNKHIDIIKCWKEAQVDNTSITFDDIKIKKSVIKKEVVKIPKIKNTEYWYNYIKNTYFSMNLYLEGLLFFFFYQLSRDLRDIFFYLIYDVDEINKEDVMERLHEKYNKFLEEINEIKKFYKCDVDDSIIVDKMNEKVKELKNENSSDEEIQVY